MATILDGKAFAALCKESIRQRVKALEERGCRPGLAVVLVGNNPASKVYVRNKENDCRECGIYSAMYTLPEETTEEQLLELLETLNQDKSVHGVLVQLPVPKQIDPQKVIEAIDPRKDVDCFHPVNVGYLTQECPGLHPVLRQVLSGSWSIMASTRQESTAWWWAGAILLESPWHCCCCRKTVQ